MAGTPRDFRRWEEERTSITTEKLIDDFLKQTEEPKGNFSNKREWLRLYLKEIIEKSRKEEKWEYKKVPAASVMRNESIELELLNELGENGWQFCYATNWLNSIAFLYFKRRKL